jgi:fatty acid desaturase
MYLKIFKYQNDLSYNLTAFSFLLVSYLSGWLLFFSDSGWQNGIGILLLAHAMGLAAFFIHEFAHGNIFKSKVWNRRAGSILMWLTFHGFFSFKRIQQLHLNHHSKHIDVIYFDFHHYLAQKPFLQKLLISLEWAYIPAVELLVKWHSVRRVWQTGDPMTRRLIWLSLLLYSGLLILLAWFQPQALLCLAIAYLLLLHILRFMDMHQHTYIAHPLDAQGKVVNLPKLDKVYEQANTYTNLFSSRYVWLNWFTLNFGYHNAHHAKPFTPWCRLPELHKTLNYENKELLMSALLINYHRFRVQRVYDAQIGHLNADAPPALRASHFIGVIGASFLNA